MKPDSNSSVLRDTHAGRVTSGQRDGPGRDVGDAGSTKKSGNALEAIDLSLVLDREGHFVAAAMLICNELKARFEAAQVALGWADRHRIKIVAISNLQKFDRRDRKLEALRHAMEECADQHEEIVVPISDDDTYISYEHERYWREVNAQAVASIPIVHDDHVCGVITVERNQDAFNESELLSLRLIADVLAKRLQDLQARSQFFVRRWARGLRKAAGSVVGFEHTWTKLGVIAAAGVLAFLLFYPWLYRIDATVELKAETITHLPAPFEGFIDDVHVEVGDRVAAGDIMLSLDKRDLLLQQSESITKLHRHEAEADAAKSQGNLRQSNLARLAYQEERTRLEMIRQRLEQADLKAPYAGLVVEGDLKERIGSPVKTGDPLFSVARQEGVYVELAVPEADIHEIEVGSEGEVAFASRPERRYELVIERIHPSATPKPEGSVFRARGHIVDAPQSWWRPGMTGLAKIEVGERSILWVLTHKVVDFIRMKLWI